MLYGSSWGNTPGIMSAVETYEAAFRWGPAGLGLITGGVINAATVDSGNSPTYELRPGLLLAQVVADGSWINYSPSGTNGSEVAAGVLMSAFRMQDILTGNTTQKFYGILIGGPVQAAKLLNLDLMARAQMSDHFWFDDPLNYPGNHWFPWKRFQAKAASYQILASDNFSLFNNTGATGAVTFTLPPIANGYSFGFGVIADQNLLVTSSEGANIVAFNNAAASTLAFQTGGARIGGGISLFTLSGATKWIATNDSIGANTITVS